MDYIDAQVEAKLEAKLEAHKLNRDNAKDIATAAQLSCTLQRTMDLAQEKGASSWLTSLPGSI